MSNGVQQPSAPELLAKPPIANKIHLVMAAADCAYQLDLSAKAGLQPYHFYIMSPADISAKWGL